MSGFYKITVTVDNNRYGSYLKIYARRSAVIQAESMSEAYYWFANELRNERRYKNAIVHHPKNIGSKNGFGFNINFESGRLD
jgi:uncharacterized protein (UPF0333 family)